MRTLLTPAESTPVVEVLLVVSTTTEPTSTSTVRELKKTKTQRERKAAAKITSAGPPVLSTEQTWVTSAKLV